MSSAENEDNEPQGERWAPLGANDADEDLNDLECRRASENDKLRELEEQQEILNSALISLTSHFAQVQFRLKQIVDAPTEEKETLLKDLEQFAFRAIPELSTPNMQAQDKIGIQREKQKELIKQLKEQLEELENYAYETGNSGLPQNVLMERQKVIIDQLQGKLNLNVDNLEKLTVDDLKNEVDQAISELVNPLKMKEHLVTQLKTQIIDLERFISFLQITGEHTDIGSSSSSCSTQGINTYPKNKGSHYRGFQRPTTETDKDVHEKTLNIIKKMATLVQMFAVAQFGCGSSAMRKSTMEKKRSNPNNWSDLEAKLEIAIGHVLMLSSNTDSLEDSDSESESPSVNNEDVINAVRKEFAPSLRDLLQHGLMPVGQSASVVPFMGCFPQRSSFTQKHMHFWEYIMKYYELKNGDSFNAAPVRKLSTSFALDIPGMSTKENMLGAIGNILSTHSRYKRSQDTHFKAFICASLNAHKLVPWLKLLLKCQPLVEKYYQPWSFVVKTGFENSYESLNRLSDTNFDLPVDIAVRQFNNIKDAF